MENLTKEMQEMLSKHLPAMQAEEFRKFIEDAQTTKKKLEGMEKLLTSKDKQVEKLLKQKSYFDKALGLYNEAENKLKAAEQKDRNLSIETLKIQLSAEQRVTNNMREFLSLISKNPRAIEIMNYSNSEH